MLFRSDLDVTPAIREARKRVQYGVSDELLELAGVRSVGRKRARRLFDAGIESRAQLREANKSVVLGALRGREKTAETVLENAGRQDYSMEGVSADDSARPSGGSSGERAREDAEDSSDSDDAGQASLGDF